MVISLYICEIPKTVDKSDLEDLFKSMDGFIDSRLKPTNDQRKIAFVDFKEEKQAFFALETLQGFKFSPEDKGLIIKVSDNSKGGMYQPNKRDDRKNMNFKRHRDSNDKDDRVRPRSRYKSPQRSPSERSSSPYSENNHNHNNNNSNATNDRKLNESNVSLPANNSNILDLISLLSNAQSTSNPNPSTNKPYTLPDTSLNSSSNQNPNDPNLFTNLLECIQNLQTVQLFSSLAGSNPALIPGEPQSSTVKRENMPSTSRHASIKSTSNSFSNSLSKFDDYFRSSVDFRKNATNIVYVEGLPNDTNEREVAHVFRPFAGFKSVRLITREKNGQKSLICFADFEDVMQSTICINTLQGYRFDKNDLIGLHFSYGVNKNRERK